MAGFPCDWRPAGSGSARALEQRPADLHPLLGREASRLAHDSIAGSSRRRAGVPIASLFLGRPFASEPANGRCAGAPRDSRNKNGMKPNCAPNSHFAQPRPTRFHGVAKRVAFRRHAACRLGSGRPPSRPDPSRSPASLTICSRRMPAKRSRWARGDRAVETDFGQQPQHGARHRSGRFRRETNDPIRPARAGATSAGASDR